MQLFTKRFMTLMLSVFFGITLIACGGETTTTEYAPGDLKIPLLSNPDAVFYSMEDYDITYRDLYNGVKVNDGLNQLLAMIDRDILSDYLNQITQDEIDEKRTKLMYGTSDPDEIADMDPDKLADYELSFEESMYLLGYTNNIDDYVKLVVAREKYARDLMLSEDSVEETWHVGPSEIANYYNATYQQDLKSIKIKFISEGDAKSVMRNFNLVSKNGEMLLYTGTTPLDQVPSSALNETNTSSLTDGEILDYFIDMYNYVYQDYRDILSKDSTVDELLMIDDLTVKYDDLRKANVSLAGFVYRSLGNYIDYTNEDSTKLYYTYSPVKYYSSRDTSYYLILNLTGSDKADVSEFEGDELALVQLIGQDVYDEIEEKMVDTNLSSESFVSRRMAELRKEHDLVIYDYYLGVDYKAVDPTYEEHEEGHVEYVATYDDVIITADDLLTYALNVNAPLYLIYSSQLKSVMAAHYEDVYCRDTESCEYDYTENESVKMLEHVADFDSLRQQFEESMYSDYYTFEDYLYLAYGVKNVEEMIRNYYVKGTLQPLYIFDMIHENDYAILNTLLDLMQPYYDNYFSLDVKHLLIYLDRNEDGQPDNWEDFYQELDDTTVFDTKISNFETAIRDYLADDEDNNFSTLITEYKAAKRDDTTWGEFKRYGLFIMTENLSSSVSLSYSGSINTYEDSFVDALIDLYQEYNLEANLEEDYLYMDSLVETSYGLHLIMAEKGDDFEMPSAKFTMTFDEDEEPEYTEGIENDSDILSFEQLKLYAMYRFSVISFGAIDLEELYGFERPAIPDSVTEALDAFVKDLHDALYVVGYLNIGITEEVANGQFINANSSYCDFTEAEFLEVIEEIGDIYFRQIFADLDLR